MDRIQLQASKLWDLLFSDETGETYQNALNLTGTILKESAQLIWLVICSVFVFGAWFSDASVKTGNSLRTWINDQGDSSAKPGAEAPALADKGKDLLETGRVGIANLLSQAREELGLEPLPPTALKKKIKPATAPLPDAEPVSESEPEVETAPTTTTAAPSVATVTESESTPSPESTFTEPAAASVVVEDSEDDDDDEVEEDEVTREVVDDGWSAADED